MNKYTDGTNTVSASNYEEAAEKLYGQQYYHNPGVRPEISASIPTTYVYKHRGYASVRVYKVGDKQGSFWGVQQAVPARYTIKRI